jgi:hypothetical protein
MAHLKSKHLISELLLSKPPFNKCGQQAGPNTARSNVHSARSAVQPLEAGSHGATNNPCRWEGGSGFGGSITPHFITMAACTLILHPFYCESASWPETDGKKTFCGLRRGRLENGQLERRLETTPKTLELSTPTRTPRSNLSIPTPQRLHLSRKGMDRQPRCL